MKIRSDFVTNSSSSSFILILKEEDYQTLLAEMPEEMQEALSSLNAGTMDIFGVEVRTFETWSGHSDSCWEYIDAAAGEQWEAFRELLRNKNINTRSISMDH